MTDIERVPEIRGKTIRFIWTDGPTKGKTHEHVFHPDGTVTWSDAEAAKGPCQGKAAVRCHGSRRQVYLVSYLAPSGYTLTVALNFRRSAARGLRLGCEGLVPGSRHLPGQGDRR